MSRFSELMSQPLRSKRGYYQESDEDDYSGFADDSVDNMDYDDENDVSGLDIDDIDMGDDFDIDDLSDEDLDNLGGNLSDDALDIAANRDSNGEEERLTPDEEVEADDMMSVAATSMLVNDELNDEEKKDFVSNEFEVAAAVNEGFMTESDINELCMEAGLFQENNYNKKMIIRLDAAAKKKQLYALAVNVSAAAHNDPDYRRLRKIMRARKIVRSRLDKKYHNEALKRMKIYFNRLRKSRSNTLQKVAAAVGNKIQ